MRRNFIRWLKRIICKLKAFRILYLYRPVLKAYFQFEVQEYMVIFKIYFPETFHYMHLPHPNIDNNKSKLILIQE